MERNTDWTIEGNITEIRTTPDGDYDFTCNCWASSDFLIITNLHTYKFTAAIDYGNEKEESYWEVEELKNYEKNEFPYRLKTFSDSPFTSFVSSHDFCDSIEIKYEDATLYITSEVPHYSLFSLQIPEVFEEITIARESASSLPFKWSEIEDYVVIEFEIV